jgi:hypothetical protein
VTRLDLFAPDLVVFSGWCPGGSRGPFSLEAGLLREGFLQLQDLALHIDRDPARKITARDRRRRA